MGQEESREAPIEQSTFGDFLRLISCSKGFTKLYTPRRKPWENKDLDILEFFKVFSFSLAACSVFGVYFYKNPTLDVSN